MKQKAIIIDIDGTLAKNRVQATPRMNHWKDYWPLYEHIPWDEVQEWCLDIIRHYLKTRIIFLTARPEHTRIDTHQWLTQHLPLSIDLDYEIIMMPDDYPENMSVETYKSVEAYKLLKNYDVLFAIDDNKSVCEMYERLGIKALHCNVSCGVK